MAFVNTPEVSVGFFRFPMSRSESYLRLNQFIIFAIWNGEPSVIWNRSKVMNVSTRACKFRHIISPQCFCFESVHAPRRK